MKWAELGPSTRARDRLKLSSSSSSSDTIFFKRAGLAQHFPARVELELYYSLNEPIPDRQYPLRIGSFTALATAAPKLAVKWIDAHGLALRGEWALMNNSICTYLNSNHEHTHHTIYTNMPYFTHCTFLSFLYFPLALLKCLTKTCKKSNFYFYL
jgi:hypothetical protein